MSNHSKVGVYLCQQGPAAQSAIDLRAVSEYARSLPGVSHVEIRPTAWVPDPVQLADQIRRSGFDALVVAGPSPGHFKPAFARAMAEAGQSPEQVRLASFREHGALGSLDRAKAVVACAVHNVPFGLAAKLRHTVVNPATLVIGGGVAGIQTALEIADAGFTVFLVERSPTIGGHMAMFDKTFPTLDCAACILTPKMVAVGQNANIKLMVCSEVQQVTGAPGAYQVKVLHRATRIDASQCTACAACAEVCPPRVASEFDVGIAERRAAYMPFPQAVPNVYVIDGEACTWVQSGGKKCGVCVKKCTKGAIHLDQQDRVEEIEVGNIVVATGYDVFDARRIERYGYGKLPNVLSALEFERLTNASGPTGGKIVTKTKKYNKRKKAEEWVFDLAGAAPRNVAIIHCVGSRDTNYNKYCSRVCCMYSLKFAHLVKEKLPESNCYEFFIDMRAFGKGYEEFFERIKHEGVHVVRGRSAKVEARGDGMVLRGEDILSDQLVELPVDMVILSVGLQPTRETPELARMLGLSCVDDGWFEEANYNIEPTGTERGGIFVAGVCQGPRDIPDTVAQASAVAASVLRSIVGGHGLESRGDLSLDEIEKGARDLAPQMQA
ncbi:MAG: CoB--CoM heterodisulfide reductase iron-sulfur subunit A family protein [Deltaproteobacteria bacterium]|nr:CoB--CoM heterodisulfide reductase iron-sulfur subunit A family protein [Deltaproteobacteria bacterium]